MRRLLGAALWRVAEGIAWLAAALYDLEAGMVAAGWVLRGPAVDRALVSAVESGEGR